LREVLRIRRSVTTPTDETVDWRPVHLAYLRKSVRRFGYICESGLRDDAPVRGGKTGAALLERPGGSFHGESLANRSRRWQDVCRCARGLSCSGGPVAADAFSSVVQSDPTRAAHTPRVAHLARARSSEDLEVSLTFRRHQNRLAHAMQKFFVRRSDCGQCAA
jgi:hypothetical protein